VTQDVVEVVGDLSIIQQRTSVPVLIPDFEEGYTIADVRDIRRAALLIEGRTVVQKWIAFEVPKDPHDEVEPGTHYSVYAGQHLRLPKITGEDILCLVQQLVPSATVAAVEGDVVRFVPYKDDLMYLTMVDRLPDAPPGSVTVLFVPISEEEEGGEEVEDS